MSGTVIWFFSCFKRELPKERNLIWFAYIESVLVCRRHGENIIKIIYLIREIMVTKLCCFFHTYFKGYLKKKRKKKKTYFTPAMEVKVNDLIILALGVKLDFNSLRIKVNCGDNQEA